MKFLDRLADAYYKGEPLVSNEVFDELAKRYDYQGLGTSQENEITHEHRMWSLSKVYPGERIPFEGGINTPKLDGAAVSVTYFDGQLVLGATRGDGFRGLDITNKMSTLCPLSIEGGESRIIQVVGEVVTTKGKDNLRNYASGALGLKDLEEFKTRDLHFVAYDAYGLSGMKLYTDVLNYLNGNGFETVLELSAKELLDIEIPYPTDGRVVRLNDNEEYHRQGYTSKHPKGAYALKENKDGVQTTLLDIDWQVGRSGVVAPVAILDPVDVDGATVARATLHNWKYIEELELEKGCTVEVIRAGDIIPRIVRKV